jgi:hypothetical protein
VQFESEHLDNQLPVIAKWEYTEELYKHDRDRMIAMLCKLTDTHVAPVNQCELGHSSHESHSSSGNLCSGVLR